MMQASKQLDYALQFVLALAEKDGARLSLKKFADESGISFLFLQKIARVLRTHGLVKSVKGSAGGYVLARPSEKISLRDIVEAVNTGSDLVECANPNGKCPRQHICRAKKVFIGLNKHMMAYLEKINLHEAVK
jgi:Rrf2 family protein